MQQGIKKLQWFEYLKVVFLKILNMLLCRVFANQVTFVLVTWTMATNDFKKTLIHESSVNIRPLALRKDVSDEICL